MLPPVTVSVSPCGVGQRGVGRSPSMVIVRLAAWSASAADGGDVERNRAALVDAGRRLLTDRVRGIGLLVDRDVDRGRRRGRVVSVSVSVAVMVSVVGAVALGAGMQGQAGELIARSA